MKKIVALMLVLGVNLTVHAQEISSLLHSAPFRLTLVASVAKNDSADWIAFFGHRNGDKMKIEDTLQFQKSSFRTFTEIYNPPGSDFPELWLVNKAVSSDTMKLRLEFLIPPGVTDTMASHYTVHATKMIPGTFYIREAYFGGESSLITFPADTLRLKEEIVYRKNSSKRLRLLYTSANVRASGWQIMYDTSGNVYSMEHLDRYGNLSGYMAEYYPSGQVKWTGRYTTTYYHYCRTSGSGKNEIHAYVVDHNTRRSGIWVRFRPDGTIESQKEEHTIIYHGEHK